MQSAICFTYSMAAPFLDAMPFMRPSLSPSSTTITISDEGIGQGAAPCGSAGVHRDDLCPLALCLLKQSGGSCQLLISVDACSAEALGGAADREDQGLAVRRKRIRAHCGILGNFDACLAADRVHDIHVRALADAGEDCRGLAHAGLNGLHIACRSSRWAAGASVAAAAAAVVAAGAALWPEPPHAVIAAMAAETANTRIMLVFFISDSSLSIIFKLYSA